MSEITIYHHLGLGDHIICNGLVREYAKTYDKINLACKAHNALTVSRMYADLNLSLIVGDDSEVVQYIRNNNCGNVLPVGFERLNDREPFDQQFYKLANVPFEKRWESFYCPEDIMDDILMMDYDLPKKFAIIHEDQSRGYTIDRSKINLPIVEITKKDGFGLSNYRKLLENAAEVHVIDSSVMFFVDSIDTVNDNLFVHRYARDNPAWQLPTLKKNWQIL